MPRNDPPESVARRSSTGRAYFSDPPVLRSPNDDFPDVVVIPEAPKEQDSNGHDDNNISLNKDLFLSHSIDSESAESPSPPPPPQAEQKEKKFANSPQRDDHETKHRDDENATKRELEELPDSLMDAYTLSSHSNSRHRKSSHGRRSSSIASSTPQKTPSRTNSDADNRIILRNISSTSASTSTTTPLAEVPIEEETNRERRTPTPKTPNSTSNQSSTYLTRKAHKFSSLKKKRGATNMLHRLFCASPSNDEEGVEVSTEHAPTTDNTLTAGTDEKASNGRKSPRKTKREHEKENLDKDDLETGSGCLSIAEVMERATDTFMLTAEADVRQSIQSAVQDALDAVQRVTTPKMRKKETRMAKTETKEKEADEESLASIFDHWKRKSMGTTSEENSETPAWKVKAQAAARKNTVEKKKGIPPTPKLPVPTPGAKALFPSTIEYWEAVTTGKRTPGKPPAFEDDGINHDDKPNDDGRDPPPPSVTSLDMGEFNIAVEDHIVSSKGHVLAEDFISHSDSILSAPSDEPGLPKRSTTKSFPKNHARSMSISDDDDAAFLPDDFHPQSKEDATSKIVIDQAVADARRAWEEEERMVVRKQWEEQKIESLRKQLENEFAKQNDIKFARLQAVEQSKWDAREREHKRLLDAAEAERQRKLDEIEHEMAKLLEIQKEHLERHTPKEETERQLRELRLQLQAEKDVEIKTLRIQYDRKLSDQKEQLADALRSLSNSETASEQHNQRAQKLQKEINQVRAELEALKSSQSMEEVEQKHKDVMEALVAEHNTKVMEAEKEHCDEMRKIKCDMDEVVKELKELEDRLKGMDKLSEENSALLETNSTLLREKSAVESLLSSTVEKLNTLEQEKAALLKKVLDKEVEHQEEMSNVKATHQEEIAKLETDMERALAKMQQEVDTLKANIKEINADWETKIDKTKEEVEAEKQHLALREKTLHAREELAAAKEDVAAEQLKAAQSHSRTPVRSRGTPQRSPTKSPTKSTGKLQRPSSKTPLRYAESIEVLEREKDSLEKQIKVLEAQIAEASQEHERTLREFRIASEQEIVRLKKELERRQEEHTAREHELKESLLKVDSWEKEELLEKIEQLEWDKKSDRTGGLREVQKKEELLQKISILEKNERKMMEEHENAMKELRQTSEQEVQRLKDEIERQQHLNYTKDDRGEAEDGRPLFVSVSETSSLDAEDLRKKIDLMETELENEKSQTSMLNLKLQAVEKEKCAIEASYLEELATLRDRNAEQVSQITHELESLKRKLEEMEKKEEDSQKREQIFMENMVILKEKEEELERLKKDNGISQVKVEELEPALEKARFELESMQAKYKEEITILKAEASKNLYEAKKEADERVRKLQEDHESILVSVKSVHREHVEKMIADAKEAAESRLRSSSEEERVLLGRIKDFEEKKNEALRRLSQMEFTLEKQRKESEDRVRQVAEKHAKELDDLISQLDLLEKEQRDKFAEKETEILQKDEQIENLNSQLTEAQEKVHLLKEAEQKVEEISKQAEKAQHEVDKLKEDLESLQKAHEEFVEEAEELREVACEEAREEMIERAEIQFRQANELYVKLKKQYDSSKAKAEKLDGELKETRRKMEQVAAEKSGIEVSLRAELAQARSDSAKIEVDAAQRAKDYRKEMEGLLQAAKDFERKADAAEALSRNVQKTLAALVVEKDKVERELESLQEEHEEMKQVCEELMAELEGRQNEY